MTGILLDPRDKQINGGEITVLSNTVEFTWGEFKYFLVMSHVFDGDQIKPFEVFIYTKSQVDCATLEALTRMITALFRGGGNVDYVIKQLKETYDPAGWQFIKNKKLHSIPAAVGFYLERWLALIKTHNEKVTLVWKEKLHVTCQKEIQRRNSRHKSGGKKDS